MSASSSRSPFPRSLLFVPANRTEMFARAWESDAEAIVFDLEDSVPAAQKGAARDALLALRPPDGWTRPIFVRSNGMETEHFALDVRAATDTDARLAGVVLPKIERAVQIQSAIGAFAGHERADRPIGVVLLIETPAGILHLRELVEAGAKRVAAFAFGAEDYRAGMGVDVLDPALADFARASVCNAAAAAGVPAIDAPLLKLDDPEALRAATRRAKALGFKAKFAIHPSQIATINEEFVAVGDREWARRAVEAYELAAREGKGSVALDGQMIDEATMKRAREVLGPKS